MTKAENRLFELLLEKIDGLEEKLDATALEAAEAKKTAAAARNNHYWHNHYPYTVGGGTWNTSVSGAIQSGSSGHSSAAGGIGINSGSGISGNMLALSAPTSKSELALEPYSFVG
jgi:hypothetical protein